MASEWIMYLSVIAIGVLTIAGVTLSFDAINTNTIENTVEIGLNEVINTVARELKSVLELGLKENLMSQILINRTLKLPLDIANHDYQISFRVLPGAKHWFIEAKDITDSNIVEVVYETTLPWREVSLVSATGVGLPIIKSTIDQHFIAFVSNEGTEAFRIIIL